MGKRRFINQTRDYEAKRNAQPNIPSWGWLTRTNPLAHLHNPFMRVNAPSVLTIVNSESLSRARRLLSAVTHSGECADSCQQWLTHQSMLTIVRSDLLTRVCCLLSAVAHSAEYADYCQQLPTNQSVLTIVNSDSLTSICWLLSAEAHSLGYGDFSQQWLTH